MSQTDDRDLLAEWLSLGREVLKRYWPEAPYAVLVAELGAGRPAVQLVVSRAASGAEASPPRPA